MVSPVLNEHYYSGACLVSEAPGYRSRDVGTMNNSTGTDYSLEDGMVLSQNTLGAETSAAGANTGNGTIGSLALKSGAMLGAYTVTMTAATTFSVLAPDGRELATGTTGVAYSDEIGFTVTAGGTAFVAGDHFTVTIAAGDNSWSPYTGALPASGIAYSRTYIPANGAKKFTVITRDCEVNTQELQWDPSVTGAGNAAALQAAALASLAAQHIIAR